MQHTPDLVYDPTTAHVARAMVAHGAYRVDRDNFFTWKSGIKAPVYTDCRVLMAHPGATAVIKKALASAVLSTFNRVPDYVVGVAEAGIFWSALVADELHTRHAFVRKQEKGHGVGGLICGLQARATSADGHTAVLIDDLVASGGSTRRSAEALRDQSGLDVLGVVSIVNWDFQPMRDGFRELSFEAKALVSYPQLLQAALDIDLIDEAFGQELLHFYRNPRGYNWTPRQRGDQDDRLAN